MPTIGVISCQVFEFEIACLLSTDHEVNRIIVVEDSASACLIETLEKQDIQRLVVIPHISSYNREHSTHIEVLIRIMRMSLHTRKKTLQRALLDAIRVMSSRVDALLLVYGLCGGALEDLPKQLHIDIPVFIPEKDGQPADDCVGLLLGGRECYYKEQRKVPGTFFMTPGWAAHWEDVMGEPFSENTSDGLRMIFRGYKRCLLIPTPAMNVDEMKSRSIKFADALGLSVEVQAGSMNPITAAWEKTKASVRKHRDENP